MGGDGAAEGGGRSSRRGGGQGGGDGQADGSVQGQVYSPRFDFVPGEKALFVEDFSDTEPGDYPAKWTNGGERGQAEVVEWQGRRWLKAIKPADGSSMRNAGAMLRVNLQKKLPQKYTVEFDAPASGWFSVVFTDRYGFTGSDYVDIGPTSAATRNAKADSVAPAKKPLRHVSIAVSGSTLKVYLDDERVLLDPEGVPSAGPESRSTPATVGIRFHPDQFSGTGSGRARDDLMFTSFRVAEGGKDYAKDLAMSGRIVTHGISFDSGSDAIRPESGPTLRKLLKLLQDDAALAFEIQGHTDNQGGEKVNGPLSERRARAVKAWLTGQGIGDGRLTTRGLGASKPLTTNDTPEGRAENRRVELVKGGA